MNLYIFWLYTINYTYLYSILSHYQFAKLESCSFFIYKAQAQTDAIHLSLHTFFLELRIFFDFDIKLKSGLFLTVFKFNGHVFRYYTVSSSIQQYLELGTWSWLNQACSQY